MKVFKVNDCDWVAAETLEEAIQCGMETIGEPNREDYVGDFPCEVSEQELTKLIFVDEDAERDENGDRPEQTFKEVLDEMIANGDKFPCFFASSEY